MPSLNEGEPVVQADCRITGQEYAQADRLYHNQWGLLHRSKSKAAVFIVIAVIAGFVSKAYYDRFGSVWFPIAIVVFCAGMVSYYLLYLPEKLKRRAGEEFLSNRLLALPYSVTVYRDSYCAVNEYEKMYGYWTDRTGCVESDSLFVITGGWDRKLLVIPKKELSQSQKDTLSAHFANTFVKKYRRV